jgi:[acyl-carrier-protein] S-malonyltransferase
MVVHNVSADTASQPDEIRTIMGKQLCSPVRWYDSMRRLQAEGIEVFAEIGPGKVLAGLLKKILPQDFSGKILNLNDLKTFEAFLKEVS